MNQGNTTTAAPATTGEVKQLVEACKDATAYFNMKAQSQQTGLNTQDDNLRQKLCNAVSAATGTIHCGNLQRTHEAQQAIDNAKQIEG